VNWTERDARVFVLKIMIFTLPQSVFNITTTEEANCTTYNFLLPLPTYAAFIATDCTLKEAFKLFKKYARVNCLN
jgi:hypothetical protein